MIGVERRAIALDVFLYTVDPVKGADFCKSQVPRYISRVLNRGSASSFFRL